MTPQVQPQAVKHLWSNPPWCSEPSTPIEKLDLARRKIATGWVHHQHSP
jgi:hypothetical protein